jgi:uncharacterized protein YPO0396
MADTFEQTLKDIFGDSVNRLSQFQSEQTKRFMDRFREVVHEAIKDDLGKLEAEVLALRARVTALESERNGVEPEV